MWRGLGVRLLAVSSDARAEAREVSDTHRLSYPVLSDPERRVIKRYGVEHAGKGIALPSVFVIRRDGKVHYAHVSKRLWDRPDWRRLVEVIRGLKGR